MGKIYGKTRMAGVNMRGTEAIVEKKLAETMRKIHEMQGWVNLTRKNLKNRLGLEIALSYEINVIFP